MKISWPSSGHTILPTGTFLQPFSFPRLGPFPFFRTALDFCACRCLRRELRRIILAFALRTASVLAVCFFGKAVFGFFPVAGIIGCDCVSIIEPCSIGCTFIGPVKGELRRGITDNSLLAGLFDGRRMVSSGRAGTELFGSARSAARMTLGPLATRAFKLLVA
jgi:hypothetical protein